MFNFSENKKSLDEKLYLPHFGIELQYSQQPSQLKLLLG
jgi:hypothetical protein